MIIIFLDKVIQRIKLADKDMKKTDKNTLQNFLKQLLNNRL